MTEQPSSGWQPPDRSVGPAPGVEFGDFGPRLVAYIIDGLLIGGVVVAAVAIWAVLAFASGGLRDDTLSTGAGIGIGILVLVVTVFAFGYFPWFWARGGATPGMRMMNLRVVRDLDGGPVAGGQAILRLIGYVVSGLVFYLGYVWIFFDKRRRGWHDLIAGTVVIKDA